MHIRAVLTRALYAQATAGLRFALVGAAAAAVHLAALAAAVERAAWPPLAANVLAFGLAFCVSYIGHAQLTFRHPRLRHRRALRRFAAVAVLGFIANEGLYAALLRSFDWPYLAAQGFTQIAVAALTYVGARRWAFAAPPAQPESTP